MIDPKQFADAVGVAAKGLDRNPHIPAHGMIGLHADPSWMTGMTVEAVGSTATVGTMIDYDGPKQDAVWIPGAALANIVKVLSDTPVVLDVADSDVTIRQGKARWTLPRFNDGFTGADGADLEAGGTVPTEWFTTSVRKAQQMADTGINMRFVYLYAGDGDRPHILGCSDYGAEIHRAQDGQFVGSCDLLPAALPSWSDDLLTVRFDGGRVHIHEGETWAITSRSERAKSVTLDKYATFLDAPLPHRIDLDLGRLLLAIEQVCATAERRADGSVYVRLRWTADSMTVSTEAAESEVACEASGSGVAEFNSQYLTRLLNHGLSGSIELSDQPAAARVTTPIYTGRIAGIGVKK